MNINNRYIDSGLVEILKVYIGFVESKSFHHKKTGPKLSYIEMQIARRMKCLIDEAYNFVSGDYSLEHTLNEIDKVNLVLDAPMTYQTVGQYLKLKEYLKQLDKHFRPMSKDSKRTRLLIRAIETIIKETTHV